MRSTLHALILLITLGCLSLGLLVGAARAEEVDLTAILAHAKAGDMVSLPAGTFRVGGLQVVSGIHLKGAGYDRTIIDAGGQAYGFLLKDARKVTLSDCTVQGAAAAGVRIDGGGEITLVNLRVLRNLCGINAANTETLRIENVVAAANRNGLALNGIHDGGIVNCTVTGNSAIGFSLAHCRQVAVFNNVISGNDLGIDLPPNNTDLSIDYNLWHGRAIGKLEGEYIRHTVPAWTSLTGFDRHSVNLPISYANPARDEYWPVSPIPWRLSHAVTAGWGVKALAGVPAAQTDIRGQQRGPEMDAGAYATGRLNVGPADGRIVITTDEGVKSAGVFHKDGTLLSYLFQELPLRKGRYEFWLPTRDFLGRPIQAGDYEVRLVESPVTCEHLGYVANKGVDNDLLNADDMHVQELAYADDGRLIICNGWQEKGIIIADIDPRTGKTAWHLGGSAEMDGIAVDDNHLAYVLKDGGKALELIQLDTRTGVAKAWPDQDYKLYFSQLKHVPCKSRLAYLRGQLYLTDADANKVYTTPAAAPTFTESFSVPAPSSPAGDAQNGLLWVISEGKALLALDARGVVQQRFAGVAKPVALAIGHGRMAVASAETGKVYLFDCTNPAALKPLFIIGTGEDPVGPMQPDRFEFKDSELGGIPCVGAGLSVGPNGEIAVLHNTRVAMFDATGKLVRDTWADFCWDMLPMNFGDGKPTGFYHERGASASFAIDAKTRTWQPEANWAFPKDSRMLMFFSMGGQRYALGIQPMQNYFSNNKKEVTGLLCKIDEYVGTPICRYLYDASHHQWMVQRDSNGDGVIDARDAATPWLDADGRPVKTMPSYEFDFAYPARDGSLQLVFQEGGMGRSPWEEEDGVMHAVIARIEPDAQGAPRLMLHKEDAARLVETEIPSPFDPTKSDSLTRLQMGNGTLRVPGGWVYMPTVMNSPAMVGNNVNGSGTDLIGTDTAGRLRWFHPLTEAGPIIGLCAIQQLVVVGGCAECEFYTMDNDGLSTGNFALPLAAHFRFGLMDHPNVVQPFTGNDGQQYFLVGDYMSNSANWFALRNTAAIKKTITPLRITLARAEGLRGEPLQVAGAASSKPPRIIVHKLSAPLPIDGTLAKWRGITPQILITPDVGGSGVNGPTDCCAVARLAYEGNNLYVQVLVFDDTVVMYQPAHLFYKQDALEMSINGYAVGGFKYNLTRVRDRGDYLFRDRWFDDKLSTPLDTQLAPRKIVVLENAKDVEERAQIEQLYNVDLSTAKVIVYEFKLPMQDVYNKEPVEHQVVMKSGGSFGLGFMLDDSDQPGGDGMKIMGWPSTYGTWAPREMHAEAVLE